MLTAARMVSALCSFVALVLSAWLQGCSVGGSDPYAVGGVHGISVDGAGTYLHADISSYSNSGDNTDNSRTQPTSQVTIFINN